MSRQDAKVDGLQRQAVKAVLSALDSKWHLVGLLVTEPPEVDGYVLFDVKTKRPTTVARKDLILMIEEQSDLVQGLRWKQGTLEGSNGDLSRYPIITYKKSEDGKKFELDANGNYIPLYRANPDTLVIIEKYANDGFLVATGIGQTKAVFTEHLIKMGARFANAKVVEADGKKPYIAAIEGEFQVVEDLEKQREAVEHNEVSQEELVPFLGLQRYIPITDVIVRTGRTSRESEVDKSVYILNTQGIIIGEDGKEKIAPVREYLTLGEKFSKALRAVAQYSPFYHSVLSVIPKYEAMLSWGTMCVTADKLYYDMDFIKKHRISEIAFVLIHESLHLIMKHGLRMENRVPSIWNVACDFYINKLIVETFEIKNFTDTYYPPIVTSTKDGVVMAAQKTKTFGIKFPTHQMFVNDNTLETYETGDKVGLFDERVSVKESTPESIYKEMMEMQETQELLQELQRSGMISNNVNKQSSCDTPSQSDTQQNSGSPGDNGNAQQGEGGGQEQSSDSSDSNNSQSGNSQGEGKESEQGNDSGANQNQGQGNGADSQDGQSGQDGKDGQNGKDGQDGQSGQDGGMQGGGLEGSSEEQSGQSGQGSGSSPQNQGNSQTAGSGSGEGSGSDGGDGEGSGEGSSSGDGSGSGNGSGSVDNGSEGGSGGASQTSSGQQSGNAQSSMSNAKGRITPQKMNELMELADKVNYKGVNIGRDILENAMTGQTGDLVQSKEDAGVSDEVKNQQANQLINDAMENYRKKVSEGRAVGAGSDPGSWLLEDIELLKAPKINWKQMLALALNKYDKYSRRFTALDPRYDHTNFGIPARNKNVYDALKGVKICIDTSGSIDKMDLGRAYSQLYGLMKKYKMDAEVIYWDAAVQHKEYFSNIKEFLKIPAKGGGGTDVNCVFKELMYSKEYRQDPNKTAEIIIFFTDGCYYRDVEEKYVRAFSKKKVIWVLAEGYEKDFKPPFGKKVEYILE